MFCFVLITVFVAVFGATSNSGDDSQKPWNESGPMDTLGHHNSSLGELFRRPVYEEQCRGTAGDRRRALESAGKSNDPLDSTALIPPSAGPQSPRLLHSSAKQQTVHEATAAAA